MPDDEKYPEPPQEFPDSMPQYEATMAKLNAEVGMGISAAVEHRPTITEQLLHQKAYHEAELKRINEALGRALENVPTMALLDAIAKTGIHRR